jgi:hypothetical protein
VSAFPKGRSTPFNEQRMYGPPTRRVSPFSADFGAATQGMRARLLKGKNFER